VHFIFQRDTPAGTSEDKAQFKLDIVNFTGGNIDSTWNAADFTACNGPLDAFWTAVRSKVADDIKLIERRWYRMRFRGTMDDEHRFEDTGPPVYITTPNITGSDTAVPLPYQNAISVTLKTPDRKHWGRFYLPGLTYASLTANTGRLTTTVAQSLANATAQMINDLWEAEFQVVVPITQHNKVLGGQLSTVKSVQVDDIADVIRRRRAKQPVVRAIGTFT